MRWTCLLLAVLVLAGCAAVQDNQAPDTQGGLRDCDEIGTEDECLSNPTCETFYQPIFETVPGTNDYTRRDVYMNCAKRGALP